MKNKGLTLLELIITISVLSIIITMAAPSFNNLLASNTMKRTSTELRGLIVAAKSEAVMRGTDVYLHTIGLTSTKTLTDNWCLIATTDATIADCDHSNVLYKVDGSQMTGLNIQRHDSYATIRIDKMNGQPDFNNSAQPIDWITFEKESGKALTMQMSWMGRLYECGVDGEWYGAEAC
ncbi:pilus assembly FimT family protein [Photobacterium leiognathi]|uniref:pilus assembly FimT family protein n=2 Tax=Photobacterium leiognathi TaxID=553611 RepID=UPI0029812E11|nr:GspH/FimT family pseudopilin [Photobacterium leiognathi]